MAALRVWLASGAALALSGCIPPSPEFASEQTPVRGDTTGEPTPLLVTDMTILSGEQPVWQAEPVRPTAIGSSGGTYVVKAGDTLSAIAERENIGLSVLAETNALQAPYPIRIGQRLTLPQGRVHRVEPGDTGIGIARAYGLKWAEVISANSLTEPYVLKIGQRLRIPTVAPELAASSVPSAQESSSFTLDLEDILTGSEPAEAPPEASSPLPSLSGPQVPVRAPTALTSNFAWPAPGQLVGRYGPAGEGLFNSGLEIATAPAAPIRASADGVVAYVGNNVAGYGGMILIRHGADWITTYGRAASTTVRRGQQVRQGEIIGNTGSGSRPQLHFGLRKGRSPIDPLTKLPPL